MLWGGLLIPSSNLEDDEESRTSLKGNSKYVVMASLVV